ncbi:MAG TPA: hypothetical protein VNE67_01925 [Acetobacteraceae bacterium]|nr:hypothetical protein [Acetobacteraceae bacterium]
MRRPERLAAGLLLSAILAGPAAAAGPTPSTLAAPFTLIDKIALPAPPGHGDLVRYDPSNGDAYVSLSAGAAVVDTRTGKVVHDYRSIAAPNGMAFGTRYVYWTDAGGPGKTNQIVVISKQSWKIVGRVDTVGTSPDGIWVDPGTHQLFVGMDDNNWVDRYRTGARPTFEAKIPLAPAHPKAGPDIGVLVPAKATLYMPDDAMEEAISTKTGKITRAVHLPIPSGRHGGAKGQIYDARTNQLWVGTTGHAVLVLNADTLAVIRRLPAKGGIDQVAWDPRLGLVYTFEGGAKGFDVYDAATLRPMGFVSTGVGATHTGAADPATHNVYAYAGEAGALYVYRPSDPTPGG